MKLRGEVFQDTSPSIGLIIFYRSKIAKALGFLKSNKISQSGGIFNLPGSNLSPGLFQSPLSAGTLQILCCSNENVVIH